MRAEPISLAEQATEVELCALGHADFIDRALKGEIKKRPLEEIERRRTRHAAAMAAAKTLHGLAQREKRQDGST